MADAVLVLQFGAFCGFLLGACLFWSLSLLAQTRLQNHRLTCELVKVYAGQTDPKETQKFQPGDDGVGKSYEYSNEGI